MPLVIPDSFKPIDKNNLHSLLGKTIVYEEQVARGNTDLTIDDINEDDIVFHSQIPFNVVVIKESVDHTAIAGAFKSGYIPIMVNEKNKIVKVYA